MGKQGVRVAVYIGQGTSSWAMVEACQKIFGDHNVDRVTADNIADGALVGGDVGLLCLPGGQSKIFAADLARCSGVENIKKYLNLGGRIFATCAGAYFLGREIQYRMGMGKQQRYASLSQNPKALLGVLPISSSGPIWQILADSRQKRAVLVGLTEQRTKKIIPAVYYEGPMFHLPKDKNIEVLMTYRGLGRRQDSVAVLRCGNIIASSVHLEYTPDFLRRYASDRKGGVLYRQILKQEKAESLSLCPMVDVLRSFFPSLPYPKESDISGL